MTTDISDTPTPTIPVAVVPTEGPLNVTVGIAVVAIPTVMLKFCTFIDVTTARAVEPNPTPGTVLPAIVGA